MDILPADIPTLSDQGQRQLRRLYEEYGDTLFLIYSRRCEVCGQEFYAQAPHARYCFPSLTGHGADL